MIGDDSKLPISKEWDGSKDQLMYDSCKQKIIQNSEAKWVLLSTGNRKIIENSNFDSYWGYCNGKGKNMFGSILEKIRDELRA
jgi:N-glycosidase YbiA